MWDFVYNLIIKISVQIAILDSSLGVQMLEPDSIALNLRTTTD